MPNEQLPQVPEYYARIDDALSRRGEILAVIDAMAQDLPAIVQSTNLKIVAARLRGEITPAEILRDPVLAAWLPVIMSVGKDSKSESKYSAWQNLLRLESRKRRSLLLTSMYPLSVFIIAVLLLLILSVTVIPTLQKMFSEFQLRLPLPTRALFAFSNLVVNHPGYFAILVVVVVAAMLLLLRGLSQIFQWSQLSWLLGNLVAGNTGNVSGMAYFMGTLAEMLQMGAPVPDSIRVAGLASQRLHLRVRAAQLSAELQSAAKQPVRSTVAHNFPPLLFHALQADPGGGPSVSLLRQLAAMYCDRSLNRLEWTANYINPVAVIFIGGLIGGVVISLFMPLVSLVTSLS
ncbi:MAG: type II secretion system F family protein [Pirellula sp.]